MRRPDPSIRSAATMGVLAGIALLCGLVEAGQSYLRASLQGRSFSWTTGLLDALPNWLLLALLAPAAIAVARRVRLDDPRKGWPIAVHLVAAAVFGLAHQCAAALFTAWRFSDVRYGLFVWKLATIYLAIDFITYWAIVGAFYAIDYAREIEQREVAATKLQASLSQARLEALRAQVNPHFLFNTLNAISVLALKGDREGVVRTLSLLSDLLRQTLGGALPQEVPLERELELTSHYLEIQRIRFPDRLAVDLDVDAAALVASVPSFILQPLVENAVTHGISARTGPGRVVIRGFTTGGRLHLEVRDSGPGFGNGGGTREGIGLSNVRARLEQIYGSSFQLAYGNQGGGGAVMVEMPFRAADPVPRHEDRR